MKLDAFVNQIRGGLIVSCQSLEDEPLHGLHIMPRMAVAAAEGGAVGIRANGADDIREIKKEVNLPVIGIVKRSYEGSPIYITPTMREVEEVALAGAEVVSLDATFRPRPNGIKLADLLEQIHRAFPELLVMADISTLEEGIGAANLGFDLVASTMSGYTPYTRNDPNPNFDLLEQLVQSVDIPVIAEGHIRTPDDAARCIEIGCTSVVVGSAITRPQEITKYFVERLKMVRSTSKPPSR